MIEVIATNYNDVLRLKNTQIDRIELCDNMNYDGLSPYIEEVKSCLEVTNKPLRVMLRATPDFSIHDNLCFYKEYLEVLKKLEHPYLDGVVLGFLKEGNLDYEVCEALIKTAYPLKVTFHKAAEKLIEDDNMDKLMLLFKNNDNLDCLLTQGGLSAIENNLQCLQELNQQLPILIGGGITSDNFKKLYAISSSIHIGRAVRDKKDYNNDFDYDLLEKLIFSTNNIV